MVNAIIIIFILLISVRLALLSFNLNYYFHHSYHNDTFERKLRKKLGDALVILKFYVYNFIDSQTKVNKEIYICIQNLAKIIIIIQHDLIRRTYILFSNFLKFTCLLLYLHIMYLFLFLFYIT